MSARITTWRTAATSALRATKSPLPRAPSCAPRLRCSFCHASVTRMWPSRIPFVPPRLSAVAPYSTASTDTSAASTTQRGPPEKPDYLNDAETEVWNRLVAELEPVELVVQDISGGCGSMYGIEISSEKFRGMGMLKQQRLVNKALADLMKDWHGVQLRTKVP